MMPSERGAAMDAPSAQPATAGARGDLAALSRLYDQHGSLAYTVALRFVGEPAGAEDIVEAAFLGLWRTGEWSEDAALLRSRLIELVVREAVARSQSPATPGRAAVAGADDRRLPRGPRVEVAGVVSNL